MTLVIASQLDEEANAVLRAHSCHPEIIVPPPEAPWAIADRADALLVWPSPAWRAMPGRPEPWPGRLRWVQSGTAGMNYYPRWLLDAPLVTCARGVMSEQIAEYVMAAVHAAAKPFHRLAPAGPGQWKSVGTAGISGRTLGIVGYGSIGRAVARRALANGVKVVAIRRGGVTEEGEVRLLANPGELFAICDDIVLALPETAETRGLVDAVLLRRAKPGAHLVNVGRGSAVDHDALLAALDAGPLGYATLDVTEPEPLPEGSPFYHHPKVRLTPHIASNYRAALPRLHAMLGDNLARLLAGGPLLGLVRRELGY